MPEGVHSWAYVSAQVCLRMLENTHGPRLWITKVPPDFPISCSQAFLWNSEEEPNLHPSTLLACPLLCQPLQCRTWYWKSGNPLHVSYARQTDLWHQKPVLCPSYLLRVWVQSSCCISMNFWLYDKWRSTCLFGSCAVICLFLWSFGFFFFPPT